MGRDTAASEGQEKTPWHLSREVSLSHIFSTVAAVVTLVVFGAGLDKRLTVVEQSQAQNTAAQRQTEERLTTEMRDIKRTIREDLSRVGDKLDRLVERVK